MRWPLEAVRTRPKAAAGRSEVRARCPGPDASRTIDGMTEDNLTDGAVRVPQITLPGQTATVGGPLDMTMMYVMHHAFRRDLRALAAGPAYRLICLLTSDRFARQNRRAMRHV